MKSTINGLRWAVILLAIYWIAIFIGTHLPPRAMMPVRANDKVLHAIAYIGLSFLVAWAVPTRRPHLWRNVFVGVAICVAYAIVDEFSQIPVGRSADLYDFIADCIGIAIGTTAYVAIRSLILANGWTLFESEVAENHTSSL